MAKDKPKLCAKCAKLQAENEQLRDEKTLYAAECVAEAIRKRFKASGDVIDKMLNELGLGDDNGQT